VPDIVVFAWERIPDDNGDVANIFMLQIGRSDSLRPEPDQSYREYPIVSNTVAVGWLIDPDERSVLVYPPGQQQVTGTGRATRSRPRLRLVRDLFGWLRLEA